jgi:hypothetical protein
MHARLDDEGYRIGSPLLRQGIETDKLFDEPILFGIEAKMWQFEDKKLWYSAQDPRD